ncbi:MAG TPA: terminase small subunit protein [Alphaproteobacteria bacterium]|nr:terminase small subunit protein [Alphaproteobacteria bacterium]
MPIASKLMSRKLATKKISKLSSRYHQEKAREICNRLINGESLRQICGGPNAPASRSTVFRWLVVSEEFRNLYRAARAIQADILLEEILEIADQTNQDWILKAKDRNGGESMTFNAEHLQRAKLRIDARKWHIIRLASPKYASDTVPANTQSSTPEDHRPESYRVEWLDETSDF